MSAALSAFVFQCETTSFYSLTLYSSRGSIPRDDCEGHWQYRGTLLLTMQSLATLPIGAQAAMAEYSGSATTWYVCHPKSFFAISTTRLDPVRAA